MKIARRVVITGHVQGVFFRNWAAAKAASLGVDGWVRNRSDGSVEILACGSKEAVARLIAACRDGPPAARVDHVQIDDAGTDCPAGFTKKPTI